MSNYFVGILFAVGAGGWVYAKTMRRTGGNTKSALLAAGVVGLIAFIIIYTLIGFLPK